MPIHDWTRVESGLYHVFHQDWTMRLYYALNSGVLPSGFTALTDLKVEGYEPDVMAVHSDPHLTPDGGVAVADAPPRTRQTVRARTEAAVYARKANRIVVRRGLGPVVAVIEVVSPGNKDSRNAARTFIEKAVEFLRRGVNVLLIDPFPPTARDPHGLPRLVWDELSAVPFDPLPPDQPLAVASFHAGEELAAYVDPLAVGDPLPDAPLFLSAERYVNVPLEAAYLAAWASTPPLIRDRVQPPG